MPLARTITRRKTIAPSKDVEELTMILAGDARKKTQLLAQMEERIKVTVSKDQLEQLYHLDGLTFRQVQDYVDSMIGPGYYYDGHKQAVKVAKDWDRSVKQRRLLKEIIKDIFITGAGNAWVELGYNEDGTDIPCLKLINPKTDIDYIRDPKTGNVELDEYGEPVGFIQKKGYLGKDVEWRKDIIKKAGEVTWKASEGEDGRDRIAHFKLFGLGESYLGMSPKEAAYKLCIGRLNLEDNVMEGAFRSGGLNITVGEEGQPSAAVTDEMINNAIAQLEDVSQKTIFGFRRNVTITRMPSPELEGRAELIYTLADLDCAAMGRALILMLQSTAKRGYVGEAQQKSVDWELRIISLQIDLAELIEETFLTRLFKARKIKLPIPRVRFITKTPAILRDRMRAIATAYRAGVIQYNPEIAKKVLQELDLPTSLVETEIKEWKKGIKPEKSQGKLDLEKIIQNIVEDMNVEEKEKI